MSKWGWTGLLVHGGALFVTCVAGLMLLEKVGPDGLWTAVQAYILVGLFYNLITAMVVGFFSEIRATRTQRLIAQCFTIAVLLSACGGVGGITLVQPSWYTLSAHILTACGTAAGVLMLIAFACTPSKERS